MDAATAVELSEVAWEQFVGAVQRAERFRLLLASAKPRRRRRSVRRRDASRLPLLLAVSVAGFVLLR